MFYAILYPKDTSLSDNMPLQLTRWWYCTRPYIILAQIPQPLLILTCISSTAASCLCMYCSLTISWLICSTPHTVSSPYLNPSRVISQKNWRKCNQTRMWLCLREQSKCRVRGWYFQGKICSAYSVFHCLGGYEVHPFCIHFLLLLLPGASHEAAAQPNQGPVLVGNNFQFLKEREGGWVSHQCGTLLPLSDNV